jgi:hypothetical protein
VTVLGLAATRVVTRAAAIVGWGWNFISRDGQTCTSASAHPGIGGVSATRSRKPGRMRVTKPARAA